MSGMPVMGCCCGGAVCMCVGMLDKCLPSSLPLVQKPKLTYFNVPGRVAGLRIMMFSIYGKDGWEDERVEFKDWPSIKPTLPLRFMPLLTLSDGRKLHQADAMERWAGKARGLYPADPDEALFVDEMISTVYEARAKAPRVVVLGGARPKLSPCGMDCGATSTSSRRSRADQFQPVQSHPNAAPRRSTGAPARANRSRVFAASASVRGVSSVQLVARMAAT